MRLEVDKLLSHNDMLDPSNRFYNNPSGFAMNRYAYYQCFKCQVRLNNFNM